jgi:hypothetical protein
VLSDAQLAVENDTAWTGVLTGLSFSEDERWRFRHGAPNIGRTKPVLCYFGSVIAWLCGSGRQRSLIPSCRSRNRVVFEIQGWGGVGVVVGFDDNLADVFQMCSDRLPVSLIGKLRLICLVEMWVWLGE